MAEITGRGFYDFCEYKFITSHTFRLFKVLPPKSRYSRLLMKNRILAQYTLPSFVLTVPPGHRVARSAALILLHRDTR